MYTYVYKGTKTHRNESFGRLFYSAARNIKPELLGHTTTASFRLYAFRLYESFCPARTYSLQQRISNLVHLPASHNFSVRSILDNTVKRKQDFAGSMSVREKKFTSITLALPLPSPFTVSCYIYVRDLWSRIRNLRNAG